MHDRRGRGPAGGGPPRHGLRRIHRPARRARPRSGRLLADPRSSADPGGTRGARPGRPRAVREPDPPGPSGTGQGAARTRGGGRDRLLPRLMLSRAPALDALSTDSFDVVVIGGGITGAGVALDAASRGYSVALVERDDYAVGTSSRSSKMVHGGLRYLQNFDLGLVREALLERQLMVRLAPHLVYPTPFLVPTLGEARRSRALGIGLNMYDVMATTRVGQGRRERQARERSREREGAEILPEEEWAPDRHRTIPGEEAAELAPPLAARDPKESYLFYDCQTDDVRLVLTRLGEAERCGAVFANGAEVVEVISEKDRAAGV